MESTQNTEQQQTQLESTTNTVKPQENSDLTWGVPTTYSKKPINKFLISQILRVQEVLTNYDKYIGTVGEIAGWARTVRSQTNMVFIEITDGSCFGNLQVVVDSSLPNYEEISKTGVAFSFRIKGTFVKSPAQKQNIEMVCKDGDLHYVKIVGQCDQKSYPLAKKHHKPETLREIAHLRARTNLIGSVCRVRNNLMYASHLFYQSRGFYYINTPCITASDCEGAGEMFQVTTLLPKIQEPIHKVPLIKHKKDQTITDKKMVDYSKDFFKLPSFLTVSGQLSVETYCCSMSNVYTLGPTFRAENSNTTRHLAEFWMLEPEIAFATLEDDMDLAEDYLKYIINYCLENNKDDLEFFEERVKKGLVEYLTSIVNSDFKRVDYTEAIEVLQQHIKEEKVKFEKNNVQWGDDLNSEHEKYLTKEVYKGPIFLKNFPKEIKSFYMKLNADNKTVAAFDCLVPQVGEIIGGSAREDNHDLLKERLLELGLNPEDYWWYMDLRKYGSVPHAGFGAGVDRLVMLTTGIENIRDTIPFPRYPGACNF